MSQEIPKKARKMPKGGRKGGSVFPRLALKESIEYARKLVSKTHTSAQPQDIIHSGVVGAKSGTGNVRMSALKQYGFLKGDAKSHYSASDLAKKIASAPPDELLALYQEAVLMPVVFKKLFDTYHGDTVSKAKLKQRVADLKVHPDETATCVELYVSSLTTAGLISVDGEQVAHVASNGVTAVPLGIPITVEPLEGTEEESRNQDDAEGDEGDEAGVSQNGSNSSGEGSVPYDHNGSAPSGPRAIFNVSVTLDSSLDIEKLQRQLELLKRYGAI